MTRYLALALALFFLALALVGVVLPGVPTVPFLLLSAWFAARGSTRLHRWLHEHPRFGKMLTDWETQKAVSRRSKVVAVLMMAVSWGVMYWRVDNARALLAAALVFVAVSAYLLSRPEPR
jgi:uncharacterized membrane protein YbaN (DUF454 family)